MMIDDGMFESVPAAGMAGGGGGSIDMENQSDTATKLIGEILKYDAVEDELRKLKPHDEKTLVPLMKAAADNILKCLS